jgi:hypothetical protein
MADLFFRLAGLDIDPDPLPSLSIVLTLDRGFVLTFITEHAFSAQILEQCVIGNQLTITVGNLSATGTVSYLENSNNYAKIEMINLLGIG